MKVFVTGASGFVGSKVVSELLHAGHDVIGLARSDQSAKSITDTGAQVLKGTLEDLAILKQGAEQADGIIHTAFIHDFNAYAKSNNVDTIAINTIGEVLKGTNKPFVVTAGILGLSKTNGFVTEHNTAKGGIRSSEITASLLAESDVNVSVVRLPPSVHDKSDKGFVPFMINQARKNGLSGYPGDGKNLWPAVHRLDAAYLFRLALEKPTKGALYNAIGDEGIAIKTIAERIAKKLNVPLKSLSGDEVAQHFEWMSGFIGFDSPATSFKTQEQLGWMPNNIGLLEDLEQNYF